MFPSSIEMRSREVLAIGDQSVVLANDHKSVYLVTRHTVAKNIETLRWKFRLGTYDTNLVVIPKLVAEDLDLAKLINPTTPEKAIKYCREQCNNTMYQALWTKNCIFELPRFDGTLERLETMRFKEDSIAQLENTLKQALRLLHAKRLTHNDIALRNIFYKGTYPTLKFYLGDFGSVSLNDPKSHREKCQEDLRKLQRIVDKAKEILKKKYQETPEKLRGLHQLLPVFAQDRRSKIGRSPIKEET